MKIRIPKKYALKSISCPGCGYETKCVCMECSK